MRPTSLLRASVFASGACAMTLACAVPAVSGQESTSELFAGDSVRIDRDYIGSVLSVDAETLTVVSRGEPRCRAGQAHGEAPVCDPAPLIRHEMALADVLVERRMAKDNLNARTLIAGVVGGAAFGTAGYVIGPKIGFGKIEACVDVSESNFCGLNSERLTLEELNTRQKSADQWRGVLFFGAIGATATAIFVRKLSVGWVRVEPSFPVTPADSWGLSFTVPSFH